MLKVALSETGFSIGQRAAGLVRARGVDRFFALLYVSNNSLLVHGECGSPCIAALFVENTVLFYHLSLEITQQWESHADVFLEPLVSREAVNADP